MNEEQPTPLGPEGRHRRDAMLGELLLEVDRVRGVRRVRRRATVALSVVAVAALTVRLVVFSAAPSGETSSVVVESSAGEQAPPIPVQAHEDEAPGLVRIVSTAHPQSALVVHTDPTIVARFAPGPPAGLVHRLDDRALLDAVASIDRPAGLIRIGRTVRLTRPVSDAELALLPATPTDHFR